MDSQLYDLTMDLKDEYTALVTREVGQQLHAILEKKLSNLPEPGVLVLDFSVVTSVDVSFLDEFLLPALRQLTSNHFGDRYLLGVGIDRAKLEVGALQDLMLKSQLLFLMYDKRGLPLLLGTPQGQFSGALQFVQRTEKATAIQLSVQTGIPPAEAIRVLELLAANRVVRKGHSTESAIDYYDSLIPNSTASKLALHSIEEDLLVRIEQLSALERTAHYQLPSGAHAAEFLHLSRVFEDARFVARAATFLGQQFRDIDVHVVVTTKAANNLILGHRVADYLDARLIPTTYDAVEKRLLSRSQLTMAEGEAALIVVDVISSGWIAGLLIEYANRVGAHVVGVATIVDGSGGRSAFPPYRFARLLAMNLKVAQASDCDLCKQGIPWVPADLLPRS